MMDVSGVILIAVLKEESNTIVTKREYLRFTYIHQIKYYF